MSDHRVRYRSRRAAVLQLAAEELRRAGLEGHTLDAANLARRLEELAVMTLVGRSLPNRVS